MSNKAQLIESPSWLSHHYFPFQSRQIRILDHDIHFIDEGQGPTLLLLHGNGEWSYGFRHTMPKLSSHFRVVALDYPGFGLSKAKAGYSFLPEDHTEVVEAFVDALGLRDIRLFVEDWGGPIGLGMATRRPELIHSLIIANTWAWPAQGSPSLERFSNFAGGFIGRFLITRFNFLARYAVPNMSMNRKMDTEEAQAYYMPYQTMESRLPLTIFPREILASHEYLAKVESGLSKLVDKPVLLIWGEQDPGFGESERKRWLQYFKHAKSLKLPNAKHFVHVDEPEAVAEAMISFEKGEE